MVFLYLLFCFLKSNNWLTALSSHAVNQPCFTCFEFLFESMKNYIIHIGVIFLSFILKNLRWSLTSWILENIPFKVVLWILLKLIQSFISISENILSDLSYSNSSEFGICFFHKYSFRRFFSWGRIDTHNRFGSNWNESQLFESFLWIFFWYILGHECIYSLSLCKENWVASTWLFR